MPLQFKDPTLEQQLKSGTKLGVMPFAPSAGVLGGLRAAAPSIESLASSLQVVPETATPQMAPSAGDVEGLLSGLQNRLSQVPSGANAVPAAIRGLVDAPSGGGADMLTPGAQRMMEQMYQRANPGFRAMQATGKFLGDRTAPVVPSIGKF